MLHVATTMISKYNAKYDRLHAMKISVENVFSILFPSYYDCKCYFPQFLQNLCIGKKLISMCDMHTFAAFYILQQSIIQTKRLIEIYVSRHDEWAHGQ